MELRDLSGSVTQQHGSRSPAEAEGGWHALPAAAMGSCRAPTIIQPQGRKGCPPLECRKRSGARPGRKRLLLRLRPLRPRPDWDDIVLPPSSCRLSFLITCSRGSGSSLEMPCGRMAVFQARFRPPIGTGPLADQLPPGRPKRRRRPWGKKRIVLFCCAAENPACSSGGGVVRACVHGGVSGFQAPWGVASMGSRRIVRFSQAAHAQHVPSLSRAAV